jgi:hypothetical protein
MFDKTLSPEEIIDNLEARVGPEGRKLFEQFLRKVNELGAQRHLEARAQTCVTERPGKRGPVLAASRCEDEPLGHPAAGPS